MGHGMLANVLGQPALQLREEEAAALATAISECADAWGWTMSSDPRVMATFNLVLVCGMIYYPRVQAMAKNKKPKLQVVGAPEHGG
jgi:hypothetical protein